MRILEDFSNDRKIKKYKDLAHEVNTSVEMLTGRRAVDGIRIEDLLVESEGDFSNYQELIRSKMTKSFNADFLDYSLIMGKFFGVYNEYCYVDISQDIKKKLINNKMITKENTKELIERKFDDIYNYLKKNCYMSKEDFLSFISSLFVVRDDNLLYNDTLFKELSYILMGNALLLEKYSLDKGFAGCEVCLEYFKRVNKRENSRTM